MPARIPRFRRLADLSWAQRAPNSSRDGRLWPNVAAAALGAQADVVARLGSLTRDGWWAMTRDAYVYSVLLPSADAVVLALGTMDHLPASVPSYLREGIPYLRPGRLRRGVRAAYLRAHPAAVRALQGRVRMLPQRGHRQLPHQVGPCSPGAVPRPSGDRHRAGAVRGLLQLPGHRDPPSGGRGRSRLGAPRRCPAAGSGRVGRTVLRAAGAQPRRPALVVGAASRGGGVACRRARPDLGGRPRPGVARGAESPEPRTAGSCAPGGGRPPGQRPPIDS